MGAQKKSRELTRNTRIDLFIRAFSRDSRLILWLSTECWLLTAYPQLRQHERIIERDLFQVIVASGRAAMAGSHVGLEQQDVLVGLERAQLGHVFGRFPVHYLAIVE